MNDNECPLSGSNNEKNSLFNLKLETWTVFQWWWCDERFEIGEMQQATNGSDYTIWILNKRNPFSHLPLPHDIISNTHWLVAYMLTLLTLLTPFKWILWIVVFVAKVTLSIKAMRWTHANQDKMMCIVYVGRRAIHIKADVSLSNGSDSVLTTDRTEQLNFQTILWFISFLLLSRRYDFCDLVLSAVTSNFLQFK